MNDVIEATAKKITSSDVKTAISAAFTAPAYQTFFEVSNETGYGIKSYADAVTMGVWPSTGHEIHGFEVKVSRSDFLNEMKNPEKAMPIMQYCHRWSLVCPANMVKPDEVPATWGIYWFKDGVIRKARQAPTLEAKPLTSAFVAALVRRAGQLDTASINKAVAEAREKWDRNQKQAVEAEVTRRSGSRDAAVKLLQAMEAAYGHDLNSWDIDHLCKAVAVTAKMGMHESWSSPLTVLSTIEESAARIRKVLSEAGLELPKRKTA
jgi:hypothetical protein